MALLPACGVYGLALVGRHQYQQGEKLVLLQKEKENLEAKDKEAESPLVKKLEDLEQQIKEVQLSLWITRRLSDGQHPLLKDAASPVVENVKSNDTQVSQSNQLGSTKHEIPTAIPQSSSDVPDTLQDIEITSAKNGLLRTLSRYIGLSSMTAEKGHPSNTVKANDTQASSAD